MEVTSSDSTGRPVSELLQEYADHHSSEDHDVTFYAQEFATTKYRATHLMRVGKNWAVLQLTDGSVLKLTNIRRLRPEHGQRPFDLPFLQKRQWPLKQARRIIYVTQPRADTPVTAEQFRDFESRLRAFGSRFFRSASGESGNPSGTHRLVGSIGSHLAASGVRTAPRSLERGGRRVAQCGSLCGGI